jgi:hypothetical protein
VLSDIQGALDGSHWRYSRETRNKIPSPPLRRGRQAK